MKKGCPARQPFIFCIYIKTIKNSITKTVRQARIATVKRERLFNAAIKATTVPPMMKGVRFPIFVLTLSDYAPKKGSMKVASTLSIDITAPDAMCGRPKWLVSISGRIASYACQKAVISKNAIPTSIVRL